MFLCSVLITANTMVIVTSMTLTVTTESTPSTAINNTSSTSHDWSETGSFGLLALVYNACSAMMSGFPLFCLVACVMNKTTHEGRKHNQKPHADRQRIDKGETQNRYVTGRLIEQKGRDNPKTGDLFLSQCLSLLCLQIWSSVQHKGVQALATLDERL